MLIHVPLDFVLDNPFQRRQDYGDVAALADDIRQRGLLQVPRGRLLFEGRPVDKERLAKTLEGANGYPGGDLFRVQLAFGHRRVRAFRHLDKIGVGWNSMPVYVEAMSDDQMLDAVWSENQHRSDINAIEQAELLAEKLERARAAGGNQQTVAAEWGIDRSTVANKVRLLELPAEVQTAVRERKLSERQALALLPVVEMQAKVNGPAVDWKKDDKPEAYGTPVAPAAFLAHAVAKPDKVTSDEIRDYARRAANHAGRELPDYLATFDAGAAAQDVDQAEYIVQPTCAGCKYRHNQHCLNKPCVDAKWALFQDRIPLLAAELTGLPWSADPVCFPNENLSLKSLYDEGKRLGLVVGWQPTGWAYDKLYGATGWQSSDMTLKDWRVGLKLGRLPEYAEAVEDLKPPRRDWGGIIYEAKGRRKERVEQVFVEACAPLVDLYEDVAPLLYLLNPELGENDNPPERVIEEIVREAYRRLYLHDREELREALREAGFNPDLADPEDVGELLREAAAIALNDWYDHRDANNARRPKAARAIEKAVALFEENGVGLDDPVLGELALWLKRAAADVAAVAAVAAGVGAG